MSVATTLTPEVLAQVRTLLGKQKLDGWLLFDFHGLNPVATRVLGVGGLATRRLFVLLPAAGRPVATSSTRARPSGETGIWTPSS